MTEPIKPYSKNWMGFDGRVFLTEEEWRTYRRRPPVRYAAKALSNREKVCEFCGKLDSEAKLQAAHHIPFSRGVAWYGLTPEWLDSDKNLIWACTKGCNKGAEWNDEKIKTFLREQGLVLPEFIQNYLSSLSSGSTTPNDPVDDNNGSIGIV